MTMAHREEFELVQDERENLYELNGEALSHRAEAKAGLH